MRINVLAHRGVYGCSVSSEEIQQKSYVIFRKSPLSEIPKPSAIVTGGQEYRPVEQTF